MTGRMAEAAAAATWLVLSSEIPVPGGSLIDLASKFGVPVAGFAFFIWWAWQREKDTTKRLREIEDSRLELMRGCIEKNTEAINANTKAVDRFTCQGGGKEHNC